MWGLRLRYYGLICTVCISFQNQKKKKIILKFSGELHLEINKTINTSASEVLGFFNKIHLFYSIHLVLTMAQTECCLFGHICDLTNFVSCTRHQMRGSSHQSHFYQPVLRCVCTWLQNFFWTIKAMCISILQIFLNTHLFMNIQDVGK